MTTDGSPASGALTDLTPSAAGAAHPPFRKPLLDAGWLLLIPGIALVGFTLILPAMEDVEAARFYRDRLSVVEEHRNQRIGHYTQYLQNVQSGDPQTIRTLAAVNLNQVPESEDGKGSMTLMVPAGDIATRSASVFQSLEPPAPVLPERHVDPLAQSTLERLSIDPKSRIWLLLAGATLIFLGILPASRK